MTEKSHHFPHFVTAKNLGTDTQNPVTQHLLITEHCNLSGMAGLIRIENLFHLQKQS